MPQNDLADAAKVEELGAGLRGTALEEPRTSASVSANHSPDNASSISNENGDPAAQDLEELAAVTTGPAYSAFSIWRKRYIVIMVTWAAFISPTSANIYFPALNPLQADLHVSTTLINLTLYISSGLVLLCRS